MKLRLGFIGLGNMAEALIAGLLQNPAEASPQITGLELIPARARHMQAKFGLDLAEDMRALCEVSDIIFFCVKPQQAIDVLKSLKPHLHDKLFLSIAAGILIKTYVQHLGKSARIVRAMPNAPALVGLGVTGFFALKNVDQKSRELTQKLFSAVGIAREVKKEKLLDAVTALSGSGPAFVYRFAHALIEGGKKSGLKEIDAREMALQTILGATEMLKSQNTQIPELIRKVASPGGTTEAGLKALDKNRFDQAVSACILAASKRSEQLSKITKKSSK